MEYADFIVAKDESLDPRIEPQRIQAINQKYEIWSYSWDEIPPLSIRDFSYPAIPKCLGTLSTDALLSSGVLKLQNLSPLSLNGQGVFIAIIDTGIQVNNDYNIFSIWDQTKEGLPPDGFFYGTEYRGDAIEAGLELDVDGHGTFMASVAAGKADEENDFIGAAPESQLIIVRLRKADGRLKKFFFIPDEKDVYSEADIMQGIAYANKLAMEMNMPLVICLALGCNNGAHVGSGPLSDYLSELAATRHRAIVIAAGNEANQRIHYRDNARSLLSPARVEINVEKDIEGFYMEFWGFAPERFSLAIQSPSGTIRPQNIPVSGISGTYRFPVDQSMLTIDYRDTGRSRRDLLIFIRIENAVNGIWTVFVYPDNVINGEFDIWLPMRSMLGGDVYFIKSDPDYTVTMPGDAKAAMTTGAYNELSGALILDSGRGFEPDGWVKPDFLAPGFMISGKGLRGQPVAYTGTSGACAIVAGACAQLLEWAVVRGNAIGINSVDIKNLLIRGAKRENGVIYPAKQYGYGRMDVYESFRLI